MCLGLPGQIVDLTDVEKHLAVAEVSGVRRVINIGLLLDGVDTVDVGDWVLIHVGFAMAKIDEEEAKSSLAFIEELGSVYDDELAQFGESG
ncbi:MAG: HypC/HybG/HupF family hydrogenase formation chaperone [Acidimicrobiales bacterium]